METVSIIIPVYNVEKYLRQCLDSVICQTYTNLEIIVIDDGSTDFSGSICDEYKKNDSRVKVIHQKNMGAANAKNVGLDVASGDYIAFVDSDDYVSEEWIEIMVNSIQKYNVDVVECGFDNFYTDRVVKGKTYDDGELLSSEDYFRQYFDNWVSVIFCNKLFKSNLMKSIRFKKERRCIDDEFFTYKVISQGQNMARINDVLYHYRQRKSSAVHNEANSIQITHDSLDVLIERYRWITAKYRKLKRQYLQHDIDVLLYYTKTLYFNKELIKKHKRISCFYFLFQMTSFVDKTTLYYAIKNVLLREKNYNNKIDESRYIDNSNCFD